MITIGIIPRGKINSPCESESFASNKGVALVLEHLKNLLSKIIAKANGQEILKSPPEGTALKGHACYKRGGRPNAFCFKTGSFFLKVLLLPVKFTLMDAEFRSYIIRVQLPSSKSLRHRIV